jgi:hemolysin activation/secretion protein
MNLGIGVTRNMWYSGTKSELQAVTGSTKSTGYWISLNPSLSSDIFIHTNWTLTLRFDGQLATEPLPSNEQYGSGGVNSVRGYHEGEVFGDSGWHTGFELKTPPDLVGLVYGKNPLIIRGSAFMDYAQVYQSAAQLTTPLWGIGFGAVATVGPHFEARFIFGLPLEKTSSTPFGEPRFNFSLTSQF